MSDLLRCKLTLEKINLEIEMSYFRRQDILVEVVRKK